MVHKKRRNRLLIWVTAIVAALALLVVLFRMRVTLTPPAEVEGVHAALQREEVAGEQYVCGDSWLKKNEYGLWEMYIRGSGMEAGLKNGILAEDLIQSSRSHSLSQGWRRPGTGSGGWKKIHDHRLL